MTADFYQSLSAGDWIAWMAVWLGALEIVLLAIIAAVPLENISNKGPLP